MKAAIYTRVSKRKKGGTEQVSHSTQEANARSFAERQDWEVAGLFSDTDSGYSNDPLPQRDELARRQTEFDVVVIDNKDRISRHTRDSQWILDNLPPVVARDGSMDLRFDTAAERRRYRDGLSENQYFSERLAEKINETQAVNLAEGKWQGGQRPFGYQTDDNLHLEPDSEHSEGLRLAASLLIQHRGNTRGVADALNQEGYTRPSGGEWYPQEVRRYLSKPELKGEVFWKGYPITVKEPVLDDVTWAEVQGWLAKGARPHTVTGRNYWLTGLVLCPCGGSLHGKGRRGKRRQPQYGCSRNRPGEAANCSYTYRRYWHAEPLEEEVWQSLISWLAAAEQGDANWPYFPEVDPDDQELLSLRAELDEMNERADVFHDEVVNAQADLYDPTKENATEEVVLRLKERHAEILRERDEADARYQERAKEVEAAQVRAELRKETDQLRRLTDPSERRAVLERARLRVALWDEPVEYAGHTLLWRWVKA